MLSVCKLGFRKIGKHVVRDMKPRLMCLKTNQTNALRISNEAEQMICPLIQT